jgi:predicted secreted protein/putative hemolysin
MSSLSRTGRIIPGLSGILIVVVLFLLISGCTQTAPNQPTNPAITVTPAENMPNPASAACAGYGGTVEIKKSADGSEYGMCKFTNGTSCEEWSLFRGEGCKNGVTAATTIPASGGKKMVTFTESDNGKTSDITQGTRFAVELAENPTTGFMWNATISPGLVIQSSDYRQDPTSKGLTGAGGTRTWVIIAQDPGIQKFSATYMRSWEPKTGNETAYVVNVRVVKA